VLPFATERFIQTSVKIGDPAGEPGKWEKRLRAILEGNLGACTLTIMDPTEPVERALDGYFFFAFRYAAGLALQRAKVLQTHCRLLAVADDTGPDTLAGANQAVADWRAHGRALDLIPYPHKRSRRPAREQTGYGFRPAIFLWDAAPSGGNRPNALETVAKTAAKGMTRAERTHRDGRRGLCLLAASAEQALEAALALADTARRAKHAVRVICDFGLVLGGNLVTDKKLIGRLQGADDLPGLPVACALATEAYAAQAKFDLGDKISLVPVGRAEVTFANDGGGAQPARSRPSLPIYTAAWARSVAKI
jgi:hypothetical protein